MENHPQETKEGLGEDEGDEKLRIENEILGWFEETCFEPKLLSPAFDQPIDLVVSIEDVMKFLRLKKFHRRIYKYPTYAQIMEEAEKLGDGSNRLLHKEQVLQILLKWILEPNLQHELDLAFKVFDTEGRGFLEVEEIKMIITTYGERFTLEEVREFLRDANITGSGCVYYQQFINSMFRVAPELNDIPVEFLYHDGDQDPSVPPPTPPPTPLSTPPLPSTPPPVSKKRAAKKKKADKKKK